MSFDVTTAVPAVSLDECKAHLRVEYTSDDALIESYILAATQLAEQICEREIVARDDENALCDDTENVPPAVRAWICLYVTDLYEKRSISAGGNAGGYGLRLYDHLLDPFMLYGDAS
jgi:uncharacterized phage protein (predicted DNA packaging)